MIQKLLEHVCKEEASDLILTVGLPPQLRVLGDLRSIGPAPLTQGDLEVYCLGLLTEEQKAILKERKSIDFSKGFPGLSRFRFNVFHQRDSLALAARRIPFDIPDFESLGLPAATCSRLALKPHGLVLVTGAAGSGKSTTLASMIDYINRQRPAHIICLEDPIEYLHQHRMSTVEQREIYEDTPSFETALHDVFRQSPDVIMVGELRDTESMQLALTLAETGHLVLGTLHTQDAVQAVSRIMNFFPSSRQEQGFAQLSMVLSGVISQILLRTVDSTRRVLAYEVMLASTAVRNLIRERQLQQLYSTIQTGGDAGMVTMNESLFRLVGRGLVDPASALERSPRPAELERMLER